MLIRRQFVTVNEQKYLIVRILRDFTTEEIAHQIHQELGTDTLLKDNEGRWFCCFKLQDASFRDLTEEELIRMENQQSSPAECPVEYGVGKIVDEKI